MLLKGTRPPAQISTGTAIEILKSESLLGAYSIDRIGIDFFCSKPTFGLPLGKPLEATLHMTEETSLSQVDRQFFFPTSRQRLPETALPLQTWRAFLTLASSTTLIRSRKAPHTTLGRPPDNERKPRLESRDNCW